MSTSGSLPRPTSDTRRPTTRSPICWNTARYATTTTGRVLQSGLDGYPGRRVVHLLERVERLTEVSAPGSILDREKALLREALASLPDPNSFEGTLRRRVEAVLQDG
jgi:hypothetical protein